MKTLLGLIVIAGLGVGGWFIYTTYFTPERRACSRLAELCGDGKRLERCDEKLGELRKLAGDEAHGKATRCIGEAKTCMNAVGCVAGASLSGVGQFLEGLVDGFAPAARDEGKKLLERAQKGIKEKGKQALEDLRKAIHDATK
jgi:hypothetical protein